MHNQLRNNLILVTGTGYTQPILPDRKIDKGVAAFRTRLSFANVVGGRIGELQGSTGDHSSAGIRHHHGDRSLGSGLRPGIHG
jgi:hypothetical protein